ncbi:hypothetical protein GOP47_0023199 [Adiantum capillus-veneris]|uniref:Receptor-like serine/threonine-protein kinase n=1 Tax=Adiantum capillus-veneris TaxID=13818 RepID=A0A9D4U7A0_ADICA|nr:hypothetical protein GOP47_0023199 [Adiantum capillus-veneris]
MLLLICATMANPSFLIIFRLLICGAPSFFFLCAKASAGQSETWQLNTAYTLSHSNFTNNVSSFLEESALQFKYYPGSYGFLILRGENITTEGSSITSSVCLCLLASKTSSSPLSMSDFSFTLSIYLYEAHFVNGGIIVWTANHNHPIKSSNSISVHLLLDGNLVLLGDNPKTPIWSSNTANQGVSTMDISQNPVSLVLQSSGGDIKWQSADHPTDTLTVGQFLRPGHNLTSWKTLTDPSSGDYTLVMEPSGITLYSNLPNPQPYFIWNIYGINDSFSIKHTCEASPLQAFLRPGALELRDSGYPLDNASYWLPFCSLQPDLTILPFEENGTPASGHLLFFRIEYDGRLHAHTIQGSSISSDFDVFNYDSCLLPDYCGPYGICTGASDCTCPSNSSFFSQDCSLTNKLDCNGSSQTYPIMLPLNGMENVANEYTPPINISTEETCVDKCSQNCSCLAAFWHQGKLACHHVDAVRSLHGGLNQSDFFAYLKVNAIRQDQGRASKMTVIVASVVSVVVILVLLFVYCWYKQLKSADDDDDDEEDTLLDAIAGLPSRYTYNELEQITSGFERQLGRGGFGPVYAGLLQNGTKVAVKKLESVMQGNKEFKAEVAIMGGIHHNNLLGLLGFCAQKGHRLLVYEFMENRSLDQWLFAEAQYKRSQLTWDVRCKIALGTARGLAYLHDECREKVIHLDIKPQNILLDESFNAKVADFGLSRLVNRNETHVMTTMRGTPGYLAPEWMKEGVIDEKCDVYSFGMLLMEIISGRKNLDHTVESIEQVYYPEWAFWLAQQGDLIKLTNTAIKSEEDMVKLRRMINTAFLCVLENPALRPSMEHVVQMLQGHIPVDDLQLSSLHQGLFFVLKSPSSFSITRIGETVQGLLLRSSSSDTAPLLEKNSNIGGATSSFSISGR